MASQRQLGIAMIQYAADHKGWAQPNVYTTMPGMPSGFGTAKGPMVLIGFDYLPEHRWVSRFPPGPERVGYACPEYGRYEGETSYGLETGGFITNFFLGYKYKDNGVSPLVWTSYWPFNDPAARRNLLASPRPARLLIWVDGSNDGAAGWGIYPESPPGTQTGFFYRHLHGLNVAFSDGHVRHFSDGLLSGDHGIEFQQ